MGNNIIVSKKKSKFEHILKLQKKEIAKLTVNVNLKEDSKKHLTIWKIEKQKEKAKIKMINVYEEIREKRFQLSKNHSYVLLIVEKIHSSDNFKNYTLKFPNSLYSLLNSIENLTERGLSIPFSFSSDKNLFNYKIYLLNGKKTDNEIKSLGVINALKLEDWINKNNECGLIFFYYGFYLKNNDIFAGTRINLISYRKYSKNKLNLSDSTLNFINQILAIDELIDKLRQQYLKKVIYCSPEKEIKKINSSKNLKIHNKTNNFNFPVKKCSHTNSSEDKKKSKVKKKRKFNLDLKLLTQTNLDSDSNMRETARKIKKMNFFVDKCSEIYDNKLFVSAYKIVTQEAILEKHGITHILNLVGDYCINMFENKFTYRTYFIRDSKNENIESLFYEIFDFIDECFSKNGKIVIHCIQGVSRSITIAIGYLIYKLGISFHNAFDLVKEKRGVASPNIGFISQLIMFQKRIRDILEDSYFPLVFCAGSHQIEVPHKIVIRHLYEIKFYSNNTNKYYCLDPRSMYLIHSKDSNYIWIGAECDDSYRNLYLSEITAYFKILVKKEKFTDNLFFIEQFKEPDHFWALFDIKKDNLLDKQKLYETNSNWNKWFLNLKEESLIKSSRSYKSKMVYEEREIVQEKSALFIYPYYLEPLYTLEISDLSDKLFGVLCDKKENKVFLWKGHNFKEPSDNQQQLSNQEFIKLIVDYFFDNDIHDKIIYINEIPNKESNEFSSYFS